MVSLIIGHRIDLLTGTNSETAHTIFFSFSFLLSHVVLLRESPKLGKHLSVINVYQS